jgi:hypothetical protein
LSDGAILIECYDAMASAVDYHDGATHASVDISHHDHPLYFQVRSEGNYESHEALRVIAGRRVRITLEYYDDTDTRTARPPHRDIRELDPNDLPIKFVD